METDAESTRGVLVGVIMPQPLRDRLDAVAEHDGRSRSQMACRFVERGVIAYERQM